MKLNRKKSVFFYSFAFAIPACVILIIYRMIGIYPFGDQTIVFNDAFNQYLSFFDYYRNLITGKEDFFYSFELYLGHGVTGLFAYYLASPFNLIYLLFPQSQTIAAFHLVFLLKIGTCGLTAAIFFKNISKADVISLIFSTGYALCSYNIAFGFCYMWIDGVIMVPVVALGIKRIFEGKSPIIYLMSLAGAIIFNFYIGFILCGFSILFAIYSYIAGEKVARGKCLQRIRNYVISSLLAGGVSCVLLIPSVISISTGSSSALSNIKDYTYPVAVRILELTHLTGKLSVKNALLMCIVGLCIIVGLLCFTYFAKGCHRPIRIAAGILAVVAVAGFYIFIERVVKVYEFEITTDSLKNLFFGSVPRDLVYNYTPLIFTGIIPAVFAVLYFFNPAFTGREKKAAALVLMVLLLSFAFYIPNLFWHGMQVNHSFNYRYSFIFSFFLVYFGERSLRKKENLTAAQIIVVVLGFVSCSVFVLLRSCFGTAEVFTGFLSLLVCTIYMLAGQENHRIANGALFCMSVLSLAVSVYATIEGESSYGKSATWLQEKISSGNAIIEGIESKDDTFYRIRNCVGFMNWNDPLQYDYNGGSSFTSDGNDMTADFCRENGIRTYMDKYNVIYDESATRALDSLLGFKYCISPDRIYDYESESEYVYVNPYALPIAFVAENEAVITGMPQSENVFDNLNDTWKKLAPSAGDIYYALDVVAEETDAQTIEVNLICDSSDPLYARIFSENVERVEVFVNGIKVKEEKETYLLEPIYLGYTETGDEVCVVWYLRNDELPTDKDFIYAEDTEALKNAVDSLKSIPCDTAVLTDSHIITKICLEQPKTLILTVPYDQGWTVKVDGKKTESYAALGTMTAVDLPDGEHQIVLQYVPYGFNVGLALTVLSIAGSVVFLIIDKNRKKTAVKAEIKICSS